MSFVKLMADDRWSEEDILARVRSIKDNTVTPARQSELRDIMFGHITGMRQAAPDELAEVQLVKTLTEQGRVMADEARALAAILHRVLDHEQGIALLAEDDTVAQELLSTRALARPTTEPEVPVDE